jgi:hypothetical protein
MNANQSTNIKFKKPKADMVYNPDKEIQSYYQICQYKNSETKKYGTRKVLFDERGKILKVYERTYIKSTLDEFIKHHRINKYKIYPTDKIDCVGYPSECDFFYSHSELLNNDTKEYDYKNF